jgi:hypothetical protein
MSNLEALLTTVDFDILIEVTFIMLILSLDNDDDSAN